MELKERIRLFGTSSSFFLSSEGLRDDFGVTVS